ncbi:hypothetical protein [Thalassolituus oleivorans]|uniref:hypothetical protein n=1 Tax=Thalassolituus oleivorans TaxID=187493 RepID=UPI0023F0FB72|nr:hypothetical protein [Thalassolituus oleivorans]
MTTLNIKFEASTANRFPVYAKYEGQHQPQPAFLELDIRDGSLTADYSGEIGNAVPVDVWNNLILRFTLQPETTAEEIERIIEENKETFQGILNGAESEWNNSNWVGKFTDETQEIINELSQLEPFACETQGGLVELAEWIADKKFPSAGQSVEDFAEDVISSDGNDGFYFENPYNLESMLSDLRDVWADALYSGDEIPAQVAKHLIEHGTCNDSQWMEELKEFANAE